MHEGDELSLPPFSPPEGQAAALATRRRAECLEARLVLSAVGIPAEAVRQGGWWWLVVPQERLDAAREELEAYRRENAQRQSPPRGPSPRYGGAGSAVVVYAVALMLIGTCAVEGALGLPWLATGRMEADAVLAGQWWRTVTALTLHVGAGHLLSNLVFGAVFGILAGRLLGGGVAWLVIVVAGALGNLLNATIQPPNHVSIGASTAVFAALGVSVADALRPRGEERERPLRRWSPLIGGLVLLGLLGVGGERTDVAAHVTGLLAGVLLGSFGCRLPPRWLVNRQVQAASGAAAIALVAAAWFVGFAFAEN
jgi:membrane associated rhomboid family serine protease